MPDSLLGKLWPFRSPSPDLARAGAPAAALAGRSARLFKYLSLLGLPTLVACLYFLWQAPTPTDWRGWSYLLTLPSYFGFFFLVIGLLLWPLALMRWTAWLVPVLGAAWLVFLAADVLVFNAYRFHITLLMVQMFFTDFGGMGIPGGLLWLGGLVAALLTVLSAALWRIAGEWRLHRRGWAAAGVVLMLLVFTFNQVLHIWAGRYGRSEVTQFNPYLPLYLPIRHQKSAQWLGSHWPGLFPPQEREGLGLAPSGRQLVQYPAEDVSCTASQRPHIVMLVLESWQADMLNAQVMPHAHRLAEASWRFDRHISGGSATVPGLFSLLFGVHASYYESFRAQPEANPSYFTEKLHRLGYSPWVFSAGMLDRFALRPLFFSRVPPSQFRYFTSGRNELNDRLLVQDWAASLGQEQGQPRFDFLFLNASHLPYDYPPEARRFVPTSSNKSEHLLNKHIDPTPLKNDYRNSLHYLDTLIQEVVLALQRSGRWNQTWLVVTGDHAEQFNEGGAGFWGHGSNYSRWQTQTPLIIKPAGAFEPRVIERTSTHQDVVPTLLTRGLGCPEDRVQAYANGLLLDRLPQQRSTVIGSYVGTAYWVDGTVHDKLLPALRYAWEDTQVPRPEIETARVLELMREEARFFRR